MANSDAGKLQEEISTFTFRNKGSIRIPKSKREKAYIQSVDIIVESISYTSYKSAKTEPDESFYGYATLVFQDSLSDKIPLRFGRNRIYQERNEQALSQWEFHRQFYATKDYVDSFFRLLTEPDAPIPPFNPPKPLFVELPLRELYVECQEDTQFQIEYTQWEPISYVNDNSIPFDGKSQQQDGDKDNGLPDGIAPKQNSPSDPFSGNSPESNPSQLGDFANSKNPNQPNQSRPNVKATPTSQGWYLEFVWSFIDFNPCRIRTVRAFAACTEGSNLRVSVSGSIGSCGSLSAPDTSILITTDDGITTDYVRGNAFTTNLPIQAERKYGVLPATQVISP